MRKGVEAVEIVVYLGIAVLVGGLILLSIAQFGDGTLYDKFSALFGGRASPSFVQADANEVPPLLFRTWESCGLGVRNDSTTFQYTGDDPLDAAGIFAQISRARLCTTLSSVSQGCGTREDLVLASPLESGRVYRARCDAITKKLVIEGG